MSRMKKKYSNGQPRGGRPGQRCVTKFGAPGNFHRSPRDYSKVSASAPSRRAAPAD